MTTDLDRESSLRELSFLWLEITEKCNLTCGHCYAESGPGRPLRGRMTTDRWLEVLGRARDAGCRAVQFIGGEPTLHPDLSRVIPYAAARGYDFVEVFTNLTVLDDLLLDAFLRTGVHVATSFYSDIPETHDAITGRRGSFGRTVAGIRSVVAAGIPVRAGIIVTSRNTGHEERAAHYLRELGVGEVGIDRERGVGRATPRMSTNDPLAELCGQCWKGKLCVTASGQAYPVSSRAPSSWETPRTTSSASFTVRRFMPSARRSARPGQNKGARELQISATPTRSCAKRVSQDVAPVHPMSSGVCPDARLSLSVLQPPLAVPPVTKRVDRIAAHRSREPPLPIRPEGLVATTMVAVFMLGPPAEASATHPDETTIAQARPPARGAPPQRPADRTTPEAASAIELAKLRIEQEKLGLEREKLSLERVRLQLEESKERWARVTGTIASVVPILVALSTLAYTVWSFRKQGQQQARAQKASARLEFEIKAAEIAFAGRTPEAVRNRAAALKGMFAGRLPDAFAEAFNPKDFGGGKETPEGKTTFLELVSKYPSQRQDIVKLWEALFGDGWIERVKPLLEDNRTPSDPDPRVVDE